MFDVNQTIPLVCAEGGGMNIAYICYES